MKEPGQIDYFGASRALERALTANRADTAFGTRPRRIVYLFDTNIAVSYLMQEDRRRKAMLTSLLKAEAAELSGELTYQYIFSGKLPGMDETGTALISPPHWNELIRKLRERADNFDHGSRARRITDDERARLRQAKDRPLELVKVAKSIGLDKIIDQIRAATTLKNRIDATIGGLEAPLRPLNRSPLWDKIHDKVQTADKREWEYLITEARSADTRDESENILNDARTLAVIEALYRENVDAIGEEAGLRFLFVTSNSAIRTAYNRRRSELAADGIPDFIRSPLVYHPLLNFSAMNRALSANNAVSEDVHNVFLDVENAIGALFPQDEFADGDTSDERWGRKWNVEDNIMRWSSAAESIAAANLRMFLDKNVREPTIQEIAQFFENDDLFIAVGKTVRGTIGAIERDHARHMATASFEHLVEKLRQPGGIGQERRAPLSFPSGLDVFQVLRQWAPEALRHIHTLDGLLDQVKRDQRVSDAIALALRKHWDDPSVQLLAAVIYMIVGAWDSAVSCADLCIKTASLRDSHADLAREARYCKAICLRMTLGSPREIQQAREALNENLAALRRDPLIYLRDMVERSTLMLSACIVQAIEAFSGVMKRRVRPSKPLIEPDQTKAVFDTALRDLDLALENLATDFIGTDGDPALVAAIIGQAAVNRIGAELFRRYFGEDISARHEDLERIFAKMEDLLSDLPLYKLPLMGRIYRGVARVELGLDEDPRAIIDSLDRRSEVTKLTYGDELEYDYLRTRMASSAGMSAGMNACAG